MRRFASIAALLALAALCSGGLDYLHRLDHQRQAAQWLAAARKVSGAGGSPKTPPIPDDSACPICLALHVSLTRPAPPIALAGLILLALAAPSRPISLWLPRLFLPIDPRGPPLA